jgi:UMP-CMP kinase
MMLCALYWNHVTSRVHFTCIIFSLFLQIEFVLNLECPEEVLIGRLLNRGRTSGRADDTLDVIRKRLQTNQRETAPILQHFQSLGKVKTVLSDKPVEDVYREVAALFVGL